MNSYWTILAAGLMVGFSFQATAMPRDIAVAEPPPNPLLHDVKALKCVRLQRDGGSEILANACGSCRLVRLQRKRPGSGFPSIRTLTVPERSRVPLSFRGPGRTRIMSDEPCKGQDAESLDQGSSSEKRCVQPRKTADGGYRLFNTCAACRTVVVERIDRAGRRKRQILTIGGKSAVPLHADGAAQGRIVSEKSCQ